MTRAGQGPRGSRPGKSPGQPLRRTRLGVKKVVFVHYLFVAPMGSRRMPAEQSLYYDREACDRVMEAAARRAGELGVELHRPMPLPRGRPRSSSATAQAQAPPGCDRPWKSCSLSCLPGPERHRRMVFCCFERVYRIAYNKDDLSEDSFLTKVWNHPAAILPPHDQRARVQPGLRRLPDAGPLRSGQRGELSRTLSDAQCGLPSGRRPRLARRNRKTPADGNRRPRPFPSKDHG